MTATFSSIVYRRRPVFGLRGDHASGVDHVLITGLTGTTNQFLPRSKGSLIFGPWAKTEIHLSAGVGLHSNLRGVIENFPLSGVNTTGNTPLPTRITSEEVGLCSDIFLTRTSRSHCSASISIHSLLTTPTKAVTILDSRRSFWALKSQRKPGQSIGWSSAATSISPIAATGGQLARLARLQGGESCDRLQDQSEDESAAQHLQPVQHERPCVAVCIFVSGEPDGSATNRHDRPPAGASFSAADLDRLLLINRSVS
jgi:hypothetical protein